MGRNLSPKVFLYNNIYLTILSSICCCKYCKIKKVKSKIILKDSYLQVIKNSTGSKIFRNLFFDINGKKRDVLENGKLSCAFYVSSILYLFQLIKRPHATVNGLVKDLVKSGWKSLNKAKIGSILVWEEYKGHHHIGFYMGKNRAISTNFIKKCPILHHWTFGKRSTKPKRRVINIFWHKGLGLKIRAQKAKDF